ncbi:MAG: tetratricopeptide repeat protein [Planctomycetes bacterium]|nr:tetratricopeptide repeat protein [Planctomycetota bacterium]
MSHRLRRSLLLLGFVLLPGLAPAQDDSYEADLREAQHNLLKGRHARAREAFTSILTAAREEPEGDRPSAAVQRAAQEGMWRLDLVGGRYEEVRKGVAALGTPEARGRVATQLLVESLLATGAHEAAQAELEAWISRHPDDAEPRYRLGALHRELGRRTEARAAFDAALAKLPAAAKDFPQAEGSGLQLAWLGRCLMALGGRDDLERASYVLVESVKRSPELPHARLALAELYFTVYGEAAGFPSGEPEFKKVLEQNGDLEEALLGIYRLRISNFQLDPGKTEQYLSRVLAINPRSVPALVESGKLLVDDRRFEEGADRLDAALDVNPRDKRALAHRAAVALLRGEADRAEAFRRRALAIDPIFAGLDTILGDHLVALYRFADAAPCFERALEVDAEHVPALHGLARARIYTGRGPEAVPLLEQARKLQEGFRNPWRANALAVEKLLAEEYATVEAGEFVFRIHRDDRDVLAGYLTRWHQQVFEELGRKYGYTPEGKVRVEVLQEWADFSVRTIGFRGFSALGACFGRFITLVSPVDRLLRQQDFMWSATVWHEYAHVLTLGLSKQRVPRWLTEGISVHEERAKNQAWERGMDRELLDAWHNDEIYPIRLLNQAFRGPRILFGYYQGGLLVDFLTAGHGFAKVVEALKLYGQDLAAEEIFARVFGVATSELDRRFKEWVWKTRLEELKVVPRLNERGMERALQRLVRKPDDHEARLWVAWAHVRNDNPVDAGLLLAEVKKRDPGNAQGLLLEAELQRRRQGKDEAMELFRRGFAAGADHFDARIAYGDLLRDAGEVDAALEQYRAAKRCWPRCTDQGVAPQLRIARLLRQQRRAAEAMEELREYCTLTARAFQPRIDLAAFERERGDRAAEIRFLEEAAQIDPFYRALHVQLGEAYLATGRAADAVESWRVALAVRPKLDRAHMAAPPEQVPGEESPAEKAARAGLALRIGKTLLDLGRRDEALPFLRRAVQEAPEDDAGREAKALLERKG